jgi:CelD/BcsL family acetyltransferase involved in cellulose biosynthesis
MDRDPHLDTAPAVCTVDVIRDVVGLDALRSDWDDLFATSPAAAPPLRWEWIRTWWEVYGPTYGNGGKGLRILAVRRGPQLIGVLPLYLGQTSNWPLAPRRLAFISTGASEFEETCTEYLNVLHAPAEEQECLAAITPLLSQPGALGWDELHLSDLPAGAALLGLASACSGRFLMARTGAPEVCHLFSLVDGFEGYLKRLSHENRRQARKMLRDVDAEGMEFEIAADPQRLQLFFDQLIDLHRRRWNAAGKPGSFAPRHAEFHRRTAELLLSRGEAVIARLSHSGRPVCVVLGYRTRDIIHCYQQGVTPDAGRLRSPGTAAWLLLMRHQAERGVSTFDHLRGKTSFKKRFATGENTVTEVRIVRVCARTIGASLCGLAGRAARRLLRCFRGRAQVKIDPVPS